MGTRQYVGARYVPKFAKPVEWNSTLSYEALTIVTHLGNSFTSKKPVPTGVDIENTEYWVNTGNYNAQVEEYRQETVNLATKVNALGLASVKEYGAKGDGTTDDTAAIQAAINENATVFIPAGKYHTTSTITLNNGNRLVGEGRNTVEFINSFSTGTFKLADDVFIENINFETDNNVDGYALVGNNNFAVNINHVDSLGGYFSKTKSMFLKMTGAWHTLLLNDCIIDCGTETGYAILLQSNGDDSLHKDLVMRDVFVDTWYATSGGSVKLDSMFGGTMQNCIMRSSNVALYMERTIGDGYCIVDANYCKFDSSNTAAGGVVVAGYAVLNDFNCSYTSQTRIVMAGQKITQYNDNLYSEYGLNAFTQEVANNLYFNNNKNGTFNIWRSAVNQFTPSLYGAVQPIMAGEYNEMCGFTVNGMLINKAKVGMKVVKSDGSLLFFGYKNDDGIKLVVDKYDTPTGTASNLFTCNAGMINNFLRISKGSTYVSFAVSNNGWDWTVMHIIPVTNDEVTNLTNIGFIVDNENSSGVLPYNLSVTVFAWNPLNET